jgi:hypothetical protein
MTAWGRTARPSVLPVLGLGLAVLVLVAAFTVPPLTGWDVDARSDAPGVPPTHGTWQAKVGAGTVPAVALAVLGVWRGEAWALAWSWRRLLVTSYVVALAWILALALVDGSAGLGRVMANPHEYLVTARQVTDVPALLQEYVDRIPRAHPDHWPTHVAGHPPGALLFFVGLARIGLGADLVAGTAVCVVAASIPVATLTALRVLGDERGARLAAPFLVLTPAAVYLGVSADAVLTAVAAWGLAALAASGRARSTRALVGWGVVAGLLLGWCVMSSYGLPLLGLPALAVLWLAGSWRPLPVAVLAASAVVLGFAALGFSWWEAYPVLVDRYWDGIAATRPASYWMWGNLGALLVSAGPLLGAGLAAAVRRHAGEARTAAVLALAAGVAVLVADLSRMSKAEVERIWLPFVPWLTLSLALLPIGWRRWGLGLQVLTALLVQHLLYTSW